MLCPPPTTLNPVTIFEAARLPHRANPSRAAGSFFGQKRTVRCREEFRAPTGVRKSPKNEPAGHER